MLGLFGEYDVVVAGAGVTGVVAALAAGREGAKTLLVEGSGFIGGNLTAGRLTKPHGEVQTGVFLEMMRRAEQMGGADTSKQQSSWGQFSGIFDPEIIQRVIIEALEEAKIEILLHAQITDVVMSDRVRGLEVQVKSGQRLILSKALVDATGDGDVAALAGARFMFGRPSDGRTQPMTAYVRLINVDVPMLAQYMRDHPEEFTFDNVLPPEGGDRNEDYVFKLLATGFISLIRKAKEAGDYTVPKDHITVKTGMLPGEININATRVQGNALDERALSRAEVEIRKQAYNVYDFFKKYVPGFENAALLDIAPKLGVRETRRIEGDYILTGDEVQSQARFPDAIGLSVSAVDIHEPGGEGGTMVTVKGGYGIPYRALLPKGVEGLLVAGRCISTDEVAHGSTRNVPACALTGEAAGTAAALAARKRVTPRQLDVADVQAALESRGIPLGTV